MTRLELVGKLQSGEFKLSTAPPSLAQRGFRTFTNARTMVAELRKHVMLKWMHQHHEMELSDGEKDYGFIGTPEW